MSHILCKLYKNKQADPDGRGLRQLGCWDRSWNSAECLVDFSFIFVCCVGSGIWYSLITVQSSLTVCVCVCV